MSELGSIFGAMLKEFDGAARILKLEPGIWRILTHPKRQITVSLPVQMDNGEIEVFTGYRVQYNITLGPAKGGILAAHGLGDERGRAHAQRLREGEHDHHEIAGQPDAGDRFLAKPADEVEVDEEVQRLKDHRQRDKRGELQHVSGDWAFGEVAHAEGL